MSAGRNLRTLRRRLKLTLRKVEQATISIANVKNDRRFVVSDGWLARLEKGVADPTIYKLFSLSVIYNFPLTRLLKLYGIDLDDTDKFKALVHQGETQLLGLGIVNEAVPEVLDQARDTNVSLETGGIRLDVPLGERDDRTLSSISYGYIGLRDFTLYPLIRPGAIVRIDRRQTRLTSIRVHNEYDRPIYFIELRGAYACGWCEIHGSELMIVPHYLSPAMVRHFVYPKEAEIVGRVISFDTICVDLGAS